jgi:hypothetical protein
MTNKKLKHSKFKNTGVLWELLVRQITADILSKKDDSFANVLVQKYFCESTALGKERRLYELVLNEKAKDNARAERLIDTIVKSRNKLSNKELAEQKFGLIKELKSHYVIDDFLKGKISNYKELASIYKIFEESTNQYDYVDPKELYQAKNCLVEHVTRRAVAAPTEDTDTLLEFYKTQDSDMKLLSYKLLVNTFNEKYSPLDTDQKILLKEYINNTSNSLKKHTDGEITKVNNELSNLIPKVKEAVTRIKLTETANQLEKIKASKSVKDSDVFALLLSYELIREIKSTFLS